VKGGSGSTSFRLDNQRRSRHDHDCRCRGVGAATPAAFDVMGARQVRIPEARPERSLLWILGAPIRTCFQPLSRRLPRHGGLSSVLLRSRCRSMAQTGRDDFLGATSCREYRSTSWLISLRNSESVLIKGASGKRYRFSNRLKLYIFGRYRRHDGGRHGLHDVDPAGREAARRLRTWRWAGIHVVVETSREHPRDDERSRMFEHRRLLR